MKTKKDNNIQFFRNLGKLFYAIAASDHKVRVSEINKLNEVVKSHWLNLEEFQDVSTDAIHQIEEVFNWLEREEDLNVYDCFEDFAYYKNQHKELFTASVKALILKTANAIAESFGGKNKSELILITKLKLELNKN